jgi:DNA-binding response OmpR family regulator
VPQRILFVDDEAPIRELLSLFFRKKGFEVSTAITAAEGRALMDGNPFDLAILDVNLAGENGLALLSAFKVKYPKTPVVMFTGLPDDDKQLINKAMGAGADAFMFKGESLETLYQTVQKLLPYSTWSTSMKP